jgi:hypothetical protein
MSYITPPSGGSIEIFYWSEADVHMEEMYLPEDLEPTDRVGWYWHACFPGCLPDGEPCGPFETEDEATANALDSYE